MNMRWSLRKWCPPRCRNQSGIGAIPPQGVAAPRLRRGPSERPVLLGQADEQDGSALAPMPGWAKAQASSPDNRVVWWTIWIGAKNAGDVSLWKCGTRIYSKHKAWKIYWSSYASEVTRNTARCSALMVSRQGRRRTCNREEWKRGRIQSGAGARTPPRPTPDATDLGGTAAIGRQLENVARLFSGGRPPRSL